MVLLIVVRLLLFIFIIADAFLPHVKGGESLFFIYILESFRLLKRLSDFSQTTTILAFKKI